MNNNKYKTSDISLATVISLTYPLYAIERQTDQRSFFVFKQYVDLGIIIERYWSGELKVEPKAYFNQLKTIKTRLYSEK